MNKKALRISRAIVIIAAIILALAAYAWIQKGAGGFSNPTEFGLQDPATMPAGPAPVFGTIDSQTDTTVTISSPSVGLRTFAVTDDTRVISQVSAGVTAKTLSQFAKGTQVLVIPMPAVSSQARSINVLPPPPIPNVNAELVSVTGKVTAVSTGSITIVTANAGQKVIMHTSKTDVVSNALAGSTGAGLGALAVGMQVSAVGTANKDGSLAASRLQLLVPLSD